MNLQPVTQHYIPVLLRCVRCEGRNFYARTSAKMYADLDGMPFVDYYCDLCVAVLRAKGVAS